MTTATKEFLSHLDQLCEERKAAIRAAAESVLREMDVQHAALTITDRGALDCVIRARVETAVMRGWEE